MRKLPIRMLWIAGGIAALISIAALTGLLMLRSEPLPDPDAWFRPGDTLYSQAEGFRLAILETRPGQVRIRLTLEPHASGPPEHLHLTFDETFIVRSGVLSIRIAGEVRRLQPGERITVPRGTLHQPFNESGSPVVLESEGWDAALPASFVWHLGQLYPVMDLHGPMSGQVLRQIAVWGAGFDSWPAGPPLKAQHRLRAVLAPFARLAGMRKVPVPRRP